jgi:hypothetical protein
LYLADPVCTYENVHEYLDHFERSSHAVLALTETGSHCPFYEGLRMRNWAEMAAYEFLEAALEEYERDRKHHHY